MKKICKTCGATKDAALDFHVNKNTRDGRMSECKECRGKSEKGRYRKKRPEIQREGAEHAETLLRRQFLEELKEIERLEEELRKAKCGTYRDSI